MKCYLIANVVVTDPEGFAEYRAKVPALIAQYGGTYVVRGGEPDLLEGDLGIKRMIMLEFESPEAARRFYDSPEYAPLIALRQRTTNSQVAFVDALGKDYRS